MLGDLTCPLQVKLHVFSPTELAAFLRFRIVKIFEIVLATTVIQIFVLIEFDRCAQRVGGWRVGLVKQPQFGPEGLSGNDPVARDGFLNVLLQLES